MVALPGMRRALESLLEVADVVEEETAMTKARPGDGFPRIPCRAWVCRFSGF